jgi:tetratricopeptide (TPR) repeat protein
MLGLQNQITARVRQGLVAALGASESAEGGTHPRNEDAYRMYLRSIAIPNDAVPNREAIALLEQAVGMDAAYAPAWAALGLRYYYEAQYSGGGKPMFARSDNAYQRALSLDPNLMLAAGQLITSRVDSGDLNEAYKRAATLLSKRPDSGQAHFTMSYVLRYAGLLDEAERECNQALQLDPGNYQFRSCSTAFMAHGDLQRAHDFINLDAGSDWANFMTVSVLLREKKWAQAQDTIRRLSDNPFYQRNLLTACLEHRPAAEVEKLAHAAQSSLSEIPDAEPRYFRGTLLVWCGQTDVGIQMLQSAIAHTFCGYQALQTDPLLTRIRDTPEFRRLLSEAKACQENFMAVRRSTP